jgi:hypothetical protein
MKNGSAETLPSLNFSHREGALPGQMKTIAPTNMNAAQITRALSDCVNPMVVLLGVIPSNDRHGIGRLKREIVAAMQRELGKMIPERLSSF